MESDQLEFKDFYNEKFISSGSFGTVHSALNKATKDKVYAVKTMTFQSQKSQEEIEREIHLWKTLQLQQKPKAIPNFYGSHKENVGMGGVIYHMIFDYFPKSVKSLIEELKSNKSQEPLPLKQLISYSNNLINALAFMQSMKLCHRDLKPDNLLLDEMSKQIYLINFSESKKIVEYSPGKTKNEITIAGSPKYFSPEMHQAFENSDKNGIKVEINPFKSDVFSFGLILLELGTLKSPKKGKDLNEWEKIIKKRIKLFKENYEAIIKEPQEKEELNNFIS